MRPNEKLLSVSGKGIVSLRVQGSGAYMALAGTSVDANVAPGTSNMNTIDFVPKEGERGFAALVVKYPAGKSTDSVKFFLSISNENGEGEIDLKDEWMPSPDRLVAIIYTLQSGYSIEATLEGKRFTSDSKSEEYAIVKDANMLCNCAAGAIPVQAVIDVACDVKLEADALAESAELRKEIERLENSKAAAKSDLQRMFDEVARLRESRLKMHDIIKKLLAAQEWKPWGAAKSAEISDSVTMELLI